MFVRALHPRTSAATPASEIDSLSAHKTTQTVQTVIHLRVVIIIVPPDVIGFLHMALNKSVRENDWRSRKRGTQAA
jgi:hypothetical protein